MSARPTIDVATLPDHAFGHRATTWWGTMNIVVIEGTVFALLIASYIYLHERLNTWPITVRPPDLRWGTLNTIILAASAWPNQLTKRAAERHDLASARRWLHVCLVFGVAFAAVRMLEFGRLNVWWDTNAYGSVIWILIGMHTAHIFTDVLDSAVLAIALAKAPFESTLFVDVSENSLYWYFVLALWAPLYVLIYLVPRWG